MYFWSLSIWLHLISFFGKNAEKRKSNPDGPVLLIVTDDLSWGRIVGCFAVALCAFEASRCLARDVSAQCGNALDL
ncbi:hypothetical protein BJF95_18750 [Rhizobium oryziradicis]|uniref:Uncharacterized protein n=1 Tax=Rhizobium oryziradicis TaxID=1867956 RepID=A0A1Q8ZTL4_9HYPH|nr:hypothetical protein BJF95_18750 [Rhizobium oryziradicis]